MTRKSDLDEVVNISKRELKELLFWLSLEANRKWHGKSGSWKIQQTYNKYNGMLKYPITPRYWRWIEDD